MASNFVNNQLIGKEHNKMEEFRKYAFNYKTKMHWQNSKKYFYYQGSQIANNKKRLLLQVFENLKADNSFQNNQKHSQNKGRLNPNERVQIILEIQVQASDYNQGEKLKQPFLVMKILEASMTQTSQSYQSHYIFCSSQRILVVDIFLISRNLFEQLLHRFNQLRKIVLH